MDGQTDKQKIFPFYRTLSPIGAAALPAPMKTKEKVEQGRGTADHLMPLGYSFCFLTPQCMECHSFVCATSSSALQLVEACQNAYNKPETDFLLKDSKYPYFYRSLKEVASLASFAYRN